MKIICGECGKEVDSNEKHDIMDCVKHLKAEISDLQSELNVKTAIIENDPTVHDLVMELQDENGRLREASENLMDVIDGMSAQHTGVLWDGVMYAVELLREALGDDNEN